MVTKQIKHKQDDGQEVVLDIGAKAENVETDEERQFVTAAEKAALQSASEGVQTLSGKVGATGDTGGSATAGTVFGKLNKLIADLATHMGRWTEARAGYIDTIKTEVSEIKTSTDKNNTGSASGTLSQKLSHIIGLLTDGEIGTKLDEVAAKGVVKSVQRGTARTTPNTEGVCGEYAVSIPIATVDPDRCIVIILSGDDVAAGCDSLTADTLTISNNVAVYYMSWQVIEFY